MIDFEQLKYPLLVDSNFNSGSFSFTKLTVNNPLGNIEIKQKGVRHLYRGRDETKQKQKPIIPFILPYFLTDLTSIQFIYIPLTTAASFPSKPNNSPTYDEASDPFMVIRNGMLVYPKPAFHFSLSSAHYECFPSLQRIVEEVDPWCKHSKSRYSIRPEVVSFRLIYWLQYGRFTKGHLRNRSFIIDSVMGAIRLVFVL
ncbi:hypothetical protein TNCV_3140621 [Trichonephila clavipes]|nr:hypothetical protein TNCV_3140621 [Trichonephila clavipes]